MNIYDLAFSLNLFKTTILIFALCLLVKIISLVIHFELKKREIEMKLDDDRFVKLSQNMLYIERELTELKGKKK